MKVIHCLATLRPGRVPLPNEQEAEWTPGSVWMNFDEEKILASSENRAPDRPTRRQSLLERRNPPTSPLHLTLMVLISLPVLVEGIARWKRERQFAVRVPAEARRRVQLKRDGTW